MIDEEATKKRYGYYSTELTPKSHKKIIAICDGCGKIREIFKHSYCALCISCACKGRTSPMHGKHHTKLTRRKISEACKGKIGEKSNHWKGGKVKRICQECGKEFRVKRYLIKKGWGKYCNRSCLAKARMRNAMPHKTKPELIFEDMCNRNNLPFQYVGDGTLWIGKKEEKQLNPDFIEVNGKNVLVEIMGAYWHSPLLNRKLSVESQQLYRKEHYKKHKWHPIFIWDTDLVCKDAEAFVLKLLERG